MRPGHLILVIALVLAGCDGGLPTDPDGVAIVDTAIGRILVEGNGHEWDPGEIARQVDELATVYRAETGEDSLPMLVGIRIRLEAAPFREAGATVLGSYDPGTKTARIVASRLRDRLVRHELGHAICFEEQHPCDCSRVDHPGGFDLACERI